MRVCTICINPDRAEIERLIVNQVSYRNIAERFDTSLAVINRHIPHVLASLIAERDEARKEQALDVMAQLKAINNTTLQILKECRDAGKDKSGLALFAIDRIQKQIELQAKLSGILDERPKVEVNVSISQEWISIRTDILQALLPYPEARQAVIVALDKAGTA
jgi:hypothetical protein